MAEGLPLDLADLTVAGDEGRPILALDALALSPGQSLGVRGPSGAGKTTLIFALAGLVPMSGRVAWGGTDIARLGPAARRAFRAAHVGLIFQDFLLFDELRPVANASVFSLFAPRSDRADIRARARALLGSMGVPVDRKSSAVLSGGERQRVSIARALASDPGVVLADEPTASLHREAADGVIDQLAALPAEGRTLVVATHDERLLARMDRVLELRSGTMRAAA